ncbi:phosphoribosylglycinamide formyltransferase 1 [Methylacidimicrobium cyclopophantes]|uniref:Phosphoribosylglycinamide formyltransferase n=1 Tax=Methylacidimicrobium cyclopophantes TaxID=1041766 RepID=A0A5E6MG42_9BACT|nr:phosphoribosylglycinamide formyltransferase [Methylacidimicrobium cyclopophantes]VVM07215.1 phosphoribosylglycinamide formyltransferase 1 [Methylacidimicrobium cyclopophantes]
MSAERQVRLGILGSGRGSNFAAILDAIATGRLSASISVVLSDREDARILELARSAKIPTVVLPKGRYRTWLEPHIEEELARSLRRFGVDLVVLAGFLRVLKGPLLAAYPGKILNIHPSLLPAFKGKEAWKQALEAGVAETGCTVHWVEPEVDSGPILGQARVPIRPGDTPESLHARIQEAEHRLYPEVIQRLIEQKLWREIH